MKFYIYTLGCKVNTYESNVINDLLINEGYILSDTNKNNDICIINTCTVTNVADSKSLKVIRQAIRNNEDAIIIVVGCLSQVKYEEIKKIDGVDIILGNINKSKIVNYIKKFDGNQIVDIKDISNTCFENMKLNNFNKTRAFVKIQDGCDNFCSYCIIPYTRGNVRSKDKNVVLDEINSLVLAGHKEIVLTGIHTGHYGSEFNNYNFSDLLEEILKIHELKRLRISSIEITELDEKFMDLLKNNSILVSHMHIPLQSGSDKILKLMNRKYDKEYFINKIDKLRSIRPDISITTDIIVGFPGEMDNEFRETIDTVNKIKFSKIHVFPYSRREGTKADLMENQVLEELKKERVHELLKVSKNLEIDYMNKFLNKKVSFIPEVYKDGYLIGHTGNYLSVKCLGNISFLNKEVSCTILEIAYPYCIGNLTIDY